jgi:hypothetical protein
MLHEEMRVALVQPRERGGKLVAQRYRQRTEALAAGRTLRRIIDLSTMSNGSTTVVRLSQFLLAIDLIALLS